MKINLIIICILVFILGAISWASYPSKPELRKDGLGQKLQACAPTIANDAALTGNSQNIDVTNANCWTAYTANDTKFRVMSTATKVGIQHTMPGGSWFTQVVSNYKFVNFSTSGATGTVRSDKP